MIKYFSFLSFLIFVVSMYGQTPDGTIVGRLMDNENNQPIEYAVVKLLSIKDSSLKGGIYSDVEGRFKLEQVAYGSYLIRVAAPGYTDTIITGIKVSAGFKLFNCGTLFLPKITSKELQEVKVVGQMDVLKIGIDKKIYNVAEDLSSRAGTATDVLGKLPSVELDQDGNVTLRGDGKVTVLIDGRPSSLTTGGSGKTLLDALPAGSIERVEIVTNPSAKYDPDGTSGIINIVLKKNKLKGFNGLISTNAASGLLPNGNLLDGNFSLSYRNAAVNTYMSYAGRYMDGYRNNYSTINLLSSNSVTSILNQNRTGTDQNFGHTFRAGLDVYLPRRQLIAVSATGALGERNRTGDQWSLNTSGTGSFEQLWHRISKDPSQQENLDVNLNYKYDLKEDRGSLTADFTQSFGKEFTQGYYDQRYFTADSLSQIGQTRDQLLDNTETNNVFTGQTDFLYLFPKWNARFETGLKAINRYQDVSTYSATKDTVSGVFLPDTLANFAYQYKEEIYSSYVIFGQKMKKFSYQGGIRFEKAYQIPNLISDSIRIVNDYFNFFPSGHIKYSINDKSELSLSYSKRITRASAADLNPFTNFSDPFNLRKGNPFLKPEFIDSYDFGYALTKEKVNFTVSAFYRHSKGMIMRVREYYTNYAATTFTNIDETNTFGTEWIVVYKPTKWFRNTYSLTTTYVQYKDDYALANWNVGGWMFGAKYAGIVDFWKKTATIQLNVNYNGPRLSVQGRVQRRGPVDIAGEKTFKEGKISCGFKVTDIFNRQGFLLYLDQPTVIQDMEYKWLTRRLYITFSYKFGKLEMSNKRTMTGSEGGDM